MGNNDQNWKNVIINKIENKVKAEGNNDQNWKRKRTLS